jgi:hypothetical protein
MLDGEHLLPWNLAAPIACRRRPRPRRAASAAEVIVESGSGCRVWRRIVSEFDGSDCRAGGAEFHADFTAFQWRGSCHPLFLDVEDFDAQGSLERRTSRRRADSPGKRGAESEVEQWADAQIFERAGRAVCGEQACGTVGGGA